MQRLRSDLGGSHTVVTYPPLEALTSCSPMEILESTKDMVSTNLYIHIAFCEFICPFCHYETTFTKLNTRSEKTSSYIDCLLSEIEMWQGNISNDIQSLYIGGGTPTVLSIPDLELVFDKVYSKWTLGDIPICIETSPLTIQGDIGVEKLSYLKGRGVNRISIGIQSFSESNLYRARKETLQEVELALTNLKKTGIELNIDLIQDLPEQTLKDIDQDLRYIQKYLPEQVTWYTLRVQPEAGWYTRIKRGSIEIIDSEESVARRKYIIDKMEALGYTAIPGGRFSLKGENDIYKDIRSGSDRNLIGIGTSAYSHNDRFFFRNSFLGKGAKGIEDYKKLIQANGNAISSGFRLSEYELSASALVKGIRYGIDISQLKSEKYRNEKHKIIEDFLNKNLIEKIGNLIKISRQGLPFEEEICRSFFSNEVINHLNS